MLPRVVTHYSTTGRHELRRCDAVVCDRSTREGKPYCSEHVAGHPYVQELLAQIDGAEGELERVRVGGASRVDPNGLMARELLLQLSLYGRQSIPRLARDLNVDVSIVRSYVDAGASRVMISQGESQAVDLEGQRGFIRRYQDEVLSKL